MRLVPRVVTGRTAGSEDAWTRQRFEAASQELAGRSLGATENARNGIAAVAVSVWAWESGWGDGSPDRPTTSAGQPTGEVGWNVGNIHCNGWDGDCTSNGDELVRVYPNLRAGVAAWFDLVRDTYPQAWTLLMVGDLRAWDILMERGYGGHVGVDDAISVFDRVCRIEGIASMDDAERAELRSAWVTGGASPEPGDDGEGDGESTGGGMLRLVVGGLVVGGVGRAVGWW